MRIFNYILYYLVILPIAYAPFWIVLGIARLAYYVGYYVVRYRRTVVADNLKAAFPHKNEFEIQKISKAFYLHFCDFLLESIKALTLSKRQADKRCTFENLDEINMHLANGKSVIVLCGHYNNWEFYSVGLATQLKYPTTAVYQPLKNPFFNDIIYKARQRFGMKLISIFDVPRYFTKHKNDAQLTVFVNDQSPTNIQTAHWNQFLGQETAWYTGPEKIARKYNQIVYFGSIEKVKRAHYKVRFHLITENPTTEPEGFITDKHCLYLEEMIKREPQYWLWSHRRWKHKRPKTTVTESVIETH